jgi:hypothetical protein
MRSRIHFDASSQGLLMILLLSQFFFTNGLILFAGMFILFMLFINLQQPYKPAAFTIILVYHFIQISAGIWQSNYLGKDINWRSDNTDYATILSYIGLVFLFLPIIYYQNKIPAITRKTFVKHADRLSIDKTFRVYVISFFVMNALVGIAFAIPSLTQIIYSVGNIKWFLFLLFGYQSILKKRKQKEFLLFCALEFAMGFYSYFSDFKTILFFIGTLYLCLIVFVSFNKLMIAVAGIVVLFFAGVFWTSIKGEYRQFLNQGSKTQSVQVEKGDALNKLLELSEKQNEGNYQDAVGSFLDRFQYTYHFAKAIDQVPAVIPYQDGKNWGQTLAFVLTPRLINPNKGTYDASVKASKYTGIQYSGVRRGVSVSLGYFADGYIDFGYIGMFIPLLILGIIYGSSYFYFIKNSSKNYVFNYAVAGALFMEFFAFESDNIFVVGRLYANLLVFFILKIFLFPRLMDYIKIPEKKIAENEEALVTAEEVPLT